MFVELGFLFQRDLGVGESEANGVQWKFPSCSLPRAPRGMMESPRNLKSKAQGRPWEHNKCVVAVLLVSFLGYFEIS